MRSMQEVGPRKEKLTRVLVTGFEPFGNLTVNPSAQVVRNISGYHQARGTFQVHGVVLPVDYDRARNEIEEVLLEMKPHYCISLGAAPYRYCRFEKKARVPAEFVEEIPAEIQSLWDENELIASFASVGERLGISSDAGKYVCEAVYWTILNFSRLRGFPQESCFIHIPAKISSKRLNIISRCLWKIIQFKCL